MSQENLELARQGVAAVNEAYARDDIAEDRFIMGITFGGQARHTAIPVELHPFHVFTLRNGRILRWRIFTTREEALEAAGVED